MDDLIKAHDELLENAPADFDLAKHKTECPVCNPTVINEPDERGEVDKTFTQEQLDAAVEAALAPIRDELKAFKDAEAAGEVDSKIAARASWLKFRTSLMLLNLRQQTQSSF